MKILFVASLYHPHVGGIETVIRELSRRYLDVGNKVSVLTKQYPNDLAKYTRVDGVDIYRVKSARTLQDFESVGRELVRIERDIKADCVHVIGLRRPLGLLALILARKWNVPLIVSAGGGELPEPDDETSLSVWRESEDIARNISLQANCNMTFSRDLKRIIHENISHDIEVNVIHAGVDLDIIERIKPIEFKGLYIFSCRRLVRSKGVDITISAFSRICSDFPDVSLLIAGDGEERENLSQLVNQYGITGRVKFLGTVSWKDSIRWLKSALFTVVPSRSEGGGLINIEAQASGCPIVGSRAAGISEYTIENKTSLLFDIDDVDVCASRMRMLLSDDTLRATLSDSGREFAKQFSWEKITDEYLSVYAQCISDGKRENKGIILWSAESKLLWNILIDKN